MDRFLPFARRPWRTSTLLGTVLGVCCVSPAVSAEPASGPKPTRPSVEPFAEFEAACQYRNGWGGRAIRLEPDGERFVRLPPAAEARVELPSGPAQQGARVSVDYEGWELTGRVGREDLELFLKRPVIFGGVAVPHRGTPLSWSSAGKGQLKLVHVFAGVFSRTPLTATIACDQVALEPPLEGTWESPFRLPAPVRTWESPDGSEGLVIPVSAQPGAAPSAYLRRSELWTLDVHREAGGFSQITWSGLDGSVSGWTATSHLSAVNDTGAPGAGLLDAFGSEPEPSQRLMEWDRDSKLRGQMSCVHDLDLLGRIQSSLRPVGRARAGAVFEILERGARLTRIKPSVFDLELSGRLVIETKALEGCQELGDQLELMQSRRDTQRSLLVSAEERERAGGEPHAARYRAALESHARADFEHAVARYRSYAEVTRYSGREAALALYRAARFEQALGRTSRAAETTQSFVERFAPTHPRLAAELLLVAARYARADRQWTDIAALLTPNILAWLEAAELLDALLEVRSLLAAARLTLHDAAAGRRLLLANYRLAETPGRLFLSVAASGGNLTDLERGLDAFGEARFFAAEQVGKRVRAQHLAPFRGERTKERMTDYISSQVNDWYTRQKRELGRLESSYERVLQIKYQPPPRWIVAATQRVGLGWARFVEEYRSVPTPKAWEEDYVIDCVTSFCCITDYDDPVENDKRRARAAYEMALFVAAAYHVPSPLAWDAESWLAANYKAEYSRIDEFRGTPHRAATHWLQGGDVVRGP